MVVGDTQSYIFPLTSSGGSGGTAKPNILELLYTEGAEITPEDWGTANVIMSVSQGTGNSYIASPQFNATVCKSIRFPDTQINPVGLQVNKNLVEYDSGNGMVASSATVSMFNACSALTVLYMGENFLPFANYAFTNGGTTDHIPLKEVHYRGTIDKWVEAPRNANTERANPLLYKGGGSFYLGDSTTPLTEANITVATAIKNGAFGGFKDLTKVVIGATVSAINDRAFRYCSSLTAVIINSATVPTLSNSNAFDDTPIASGTGYIYVPSAIIEDFRMETNWAAYIEQYRAIEDYPDITGGLQ